MVIEGIFVFGVVIPALLFAQLFTPSRKASMYKDAMKRPEGLQHVRNADQAHDDPQDRLKRLRDRN